MSRFRAKARWYDINLKPCDKATGKYYFRSMLEWKCAKELELMRKAGEIAFWRYENYTYDFNQNGGRYKQFTTYTPDFYVMTSGIRFWHIEVKGYNSPGSATKIRRFLKHYPEIELRIYTKSGTMTAKDWLERIKRK